MRPESTPISYLSNEVFTPEEEYDGPLTLLGELTDGYATNTIALRKANNKILTLCVAAKRCAPMAKQD